MLNIFKQDLIQYEYSPDEIRKALKKIHFCDIIEFYQKFLGQMYVKVLFTGNIIPEKAQKWG